MKKDNNCFVHSAPLLRQQEYYPPKLPLDLPLSLKSFLPITHESTYIVSMLGKIQSELGHLSKSEHRVANTILASPKRAIHSSIAALAVEANISEPTVNRFCRSVDTRGLPDFRLHLTQGLANGAPYVSHNADENDSVESYTGEIFGSTMVSLDHACQLLDSTAINRAVDLLTRAKRTVFFGLGSSAAVTRDTMNKFSHFSVPVIYSGNVILQRMSCMNCNDDDVIMLISHTRRTKDLVELAQLARENGTMVVALASPDTPLVRKATLVITLDVPGDTDIYVPMVSRLARLAVTDVLATGFTLRRGAKFRDNLKRVKEALKESRFGRELLIKSDDH